MNVKAIPLYLSGQDAMELLYHLSTITHNPNFDRDETIVIIGQYPMTCNLYLTVRYDDSGEESIIRFGE